MSRIHEALRRGLRPAQPRGASGAPAHADAVLATLGYKAESSRTVSKGLIAALVVTLVLAALYFAWPLIAPGTPTSPPPMTHAAPNASKQATPPRVVSTPTPHAAPPPLPSPARTQAPTPTPTPTPEPTPKPTPRTHQAPVSALARPQAAPSKPAPQQPVRTAPKLSTAPDDFQLALYYQRAGEFDQSLVHYKAVLQRDELNVEAHNNLGLLYRDKGLAEEALREFRRALYIAPRYVRGHNNLGVTLLELDRVDAAVAEFRAALAIEPRNVDAMVNLALAQKAAGQTADAQSNLVRALAIEPHSAAAHYNLGLQYEESGEPARAVEHYRAFLQYSGPEYAGRAPDVRARITTLEARIK